MKITEVKSITALLVGEIKVPLEPLKMMTAYALRPLLLASTYTPRSSHARQPSTTHTRNFCPVAHDRHPIFSMSMHLQVLCRFLHRTRNASLPMLSLALVLL